MTSLGLRAHASPVADTSDEESTFDQVSQGLTWVGLGISLLIWGVAGFLVWIPLLVRATLSFSLNLLHATLTAQTAERSGLVLKDAINFYRRGFVVAIEAIKGGTTADQDVPIERGVSVSTGLNHVVWAFLSWYFLGLLVGVVETSPLDLWRKIAEVPWIEMLNIYADAFNAWFAKTMAGFKGP
jgi:hypothetical protein